MQQQNEIIEEIADYLGVTAADIDLDKSLRDDLGLGPIELADLVADLSSKFRINFDPAEVERVQDVRGLVAMVEDLMLE